MRILMVTIALVGLVFAPGCNDDDGDSLTLEEYFQKVEEIDRSQIERSDALETRFDELGEDASVDEAADLFDEQVDLLRDFHGDLEDVEAPEEVADAHGRAVEALGDAVDTFDDLANRFRDADTLEEAFGQFDDSAFADFERADEACSDLVQVAADNNIEVELDCESED